MPQNPHSPRSPDSHRRGAPVGNANALKHGFYTRRIKKSHLSGVESTNLKSLADEIALIRIFTRRLVEACDPNADFFELADTLRILCLASTTITRILRTHFILTGTNGGIEGEIDEALNRFLKLFAEKWESDEITGEHSAAEFMDSGPEKMSEEIDARFSADGPLTTPLLDEKLREMREAAP